MKYCKQNTIVEMSGLVDIYGGCPFSEEKGRKEWMRVGTEWRGESANHNQDVKTNKETNNIKIIVCHLHLLTSSMCYLNPEKYSR